MNRFRRTLVAWCLLLPLPAAATNDALPPPVERALAVRSVPAATLSVVVHDLAADETVLEWLPDTPRNPASTIKLLTTLVALDVLGPSYTWPTEVYAMGDVEAGRLRGDLLLKGYGDPYLVTERVWQLLRQVRQTGIHDIEGDLLIDDSYFEVEEEDPAAFDQQPLRAYNVVPNALLMNFKVVRYWFEPEFDSGSVRVWLDPPLGNLEVDNRIALRPGRCRGFQRGITISANEAIDRMTFSGRFPRGCNRYAMDRTALDHNAFVFGLFTSLWRESGGRFDGGYRNAVAPEDAEPLLTFRSVPLVDVIDLVNKHSNNVMARHLLYTLGAEVEGAPGTAAGGRRVIADWLADRGLRTETLALDNGAGLSRDVRITARDLVALLAFAWRQPYMPEYVSSLSLVGHDGTLRRRFQADALDGQAHLKTGSMDDVTAIAGYLQSAGGRRYAVAMLHNHPGIHRGPGAEVQEALLRWLHAQ